MGGLCEISGGELDQVCRHILSLAAGPTISAAPLIQHQHNISPSSAQQHQHNISTKKSAQHQLLL